MLAVDLDRGKPGGSAPLAMTCSGPDACARRVEIDEVAAADIDRADAEAHLAGIDPVEIDQPLQRVLQRLVS
jgi:hypothetical protein